MSCEEVRALLAGSGNCLTVAARQHVAQCDACADALCEFALALKPPVSVPEDFAARVAALAPPPSTCRVRPAKRPFRFAIASLVFVTFVLVALAFADPQLFAAPQGPGMVFESLAAFEVCIFALWLDRDSLLRR